MKDSDTWTVYNITAVGGILTGVGFMFLGLIFILVGLDDPMPMLICPALFMIPIGLFVIFMSPSQTLVASKAQRTLTISSVSVFASITGITTMSSSEIQVIPFSDIQSIGFRKCTRTVEKAVDGVGWVEGTETSRYIAVDTKDKCIALPQGCSHTYEEHELKKMAETLREYLGVGGTDDK